MSMLFSFLYFYWIPKTFKSDFILVWGQEKHNIFLVLGHLILHLIDKFRGENGPINSLLKIKCWT